RVRSGQARPGPWSLAGGGAEAPPLKGRVPKMLSAERFERIFGCPLTVEGHPRTLSGPSPDLSTARIVGGSGGAGFPRNLGGGAGAGGHGPALLATGVLPVRRPAP